MKKLLLLFTLLLTSCGANTESSTESTSSAIKITNYTNITALLSYWGACCGLFTEKYDDDNNLVFKHFFELGEYTIYENAIKENDLGITNVAYIYGDFTHIVLYDIGYIKKSGVNGGILK